MKPLQVGLLMLAAAVGGGLLMKWENRGTNASTAPVAVNSLPTETVTKVPVVPDEPAPANQPEKPLKQSVHTKPKAERMARSISEPPQVEANPASAAASVTPQQPAAPVSQPDPAPAAPIKNDPAPPPPPPPPAQVTLVAGTVIPIRTIEALSSDKNAPGDRFTASLTQPLVVDGFVIAERGARAEGKIVESQKAGRVKGVSNLSLQLTRITTADGQHIAIETEPFDKQGQPGTTKDAAKVGGGAALGAIIGAIAGGGKGAGIGAGVGGAAGAGDVLLTRGKPVALPSETQVSFRLRAPVTVTERR